MQHASECLPVATSMCMWHNGAIFMLSPSMAGMAAKYVSVMVELALAETSDWLAA